MVYSQMLVLGGFRGAGGKRADGLRGTEEGQVLRLRQGVEEE